MYRVKRRNLEARGKMLQSGSATNGAWIKPLHEYRDHTGIVLPYCLFIVWSVPLVTVQHDQTARIGSGNLGSGGIVSHWLGIPWFSVISNTILHSTYICFVFLTVLFNFMMTLHYHYSPELQFWILPMTAQNLHWWFTFWEVVYTVIWLYLIGFQ